MEKNILLIILIFLTLTVRSQKVSWTYSTLTEPWNKGASLNLKPATGKFDFTIYPDEKLQQIEGFGACFNELGWEALLSLSETGRTKILNDLFSREGANFTLCRIPVASNDYSLSYYSYNDVAGDFKMRNFNIDRDRYILIPYIRAAKKIASELKIWGSPWCPPAWMKVNDHYSMGTEGEKPRDSDLNPKRTIVNDATAFKMQDGYLEAYALYLAKFIQAYEKEGIEIAELHVQNEIIHISQWPTCTWRAEDMAYFIGKYLGPRFKEAKLNSEIWLSTVNSEDPNYVRIVLNNKEAASYIKGIGFQWDAKRAIATVHKEYPDYRIMQTESECGNGENNWGSAEYTWSLMNHYISNGANSYMYWNMVLDSSGTSTWGWRQNMLISITKETGEVKYNPEYYLMKHLSHNVLPGAHLLKTSGGKEHLAFINPNGDVIVMYFNTDDNEKNINIAVDGNSLAVKIKGNSINTFTIDHGP